MNFQALGFLSQARQNYGYRWRCEKSLPGLSQLYSWPDEQRAPLRDRNHFGNVPQWVPVFGTIVPGWSWNGSGACPYLRVQKKFVKFGQNTQNVWLRSAKFLGQFFSNPAFGFLWNLGDVLFSHPQNERVQCLAVPSSFCVFLETAVNFCLFLKVAIIFEKGKNWTAVKTELNFLL